MYISHKPHISFPNNTNKNIPLISKKGKKTTNINKKPKHKTGHKTKRKTSKTQPLCLHNRWQTLQKKAKPKSKKHQNTKKKTAIYHLNPISNRKRRQNTNFI